MSNKKEEIQRYAKELNYNDRLYVLNILKQHLPIKKLIEHADGTRVNLDTLPDILIDKIHHIIITRPSMVDTSYN